MHITSTLFGSKSLGCCDARLKQGSLLRIKNGGYVYFLILSM